MRFSVQILNSVSDIVRIKEPSAEDLYDDYEAVIKYVEKLRDDILDFEAKHKREEFVEFNEVKAYKLHGGGVLQGKELQGELSDKSCIRA